MNNKKHFKAILVIIEKHRIICNIQQCFFHITPITIYKNGHNTIEFSLGPSFKYENKWTIINLIQD